MEQFPPNSRKAREAERPKPRVDRVTSVDVVRRKKPLGKQFSSVFLGGNARLAMEFVIGSVILPAIKDLMVEASSSAVEKMVYGDSRPRRGPTGYSSGLGHVAYNRMGHPPQQRPSPMQPSLSRQARSQHAFDELIIPSRQEAEEVLERMGDILDKYDSVTVADLYDLTGLASSHTDHKWGWVELRGASLERVRGGGYLLDLPDPEPL